MSPVVVKNGKLLVKDGKLATNENCCCCTCQCCSNDSLTISFDVDGGSNCDHKFTITNGCILSYESDCDNATNVAVNGVQWDVDSSLSFKLSSICKQAIVPFFPPAGMIFGYGLYSIIGINNATVDPLLANTFANPNPTFTVTPIVEGNVSFTISWNCPTPSLGFLDFEDLIGCGEACNGPPIVITKTITMADGSKCAISQTYDQNILCGDPQVEDCTWCCNGICMTLEDFVNAGCL